MYNVRRSGVGGGTVSRNATIDDAAATHRAVSMRDTSAERPTREGVSRFDLPCERPVVVSYEVAYDRTPQSLDQFQNETALATALVDSYLERGNRIQRADTDWLASTSTLVRTERVFVTYVLVRLRGGFERVREVVCFFDDGVGSVFEGLQRVDALLGLMVRTGSVWPPDCSGFTS